MAVIARTPPPSPCCAHAATGTQEPASPAMAARRVNMHASPTSPAPIFGVRGLLLPDISRAAQLRRLGRALTRPNMQKRWVSRVLDPAYGYGVTGPPVRAWR